MTTTTLPAASDKTGAGTDIRETLFNAGDIGPITHVQVCTERIGALLGILFDLDPDILKSGVIFPTIPKDPVEFYEAVARPMLDRHPVLAKAEVRNSGRGNHVILRFDKPVEFTSDGERDRWSGIVQVVQAVLPIDPDQPGITATTRAIGSVNEKSGTEVTLLAKGEPVTEAEVVGLFDEMIEAPFRTVLKVMTGDESLQPCPLCGKSGSRLSALKYRGRCYGSCGDVKIEKLYDLVLAPRSVEREVESDA